MAADQHDNPRHQPEPGTPDDSTQGPDPILIVGGRVVDPASGRNEIADVAIENGRIAAIGTGLDRRGGGGRSPRTLDAEGCLVTPGLIDPHVHLREPGQEHKETIETGSAAAVAGGFTTVCCMPNTDPALDQPTLLEFVRAQAASSAACRVYPVAAATRGRRGQDPAEIPLLARAGAVGFSDDGTAIPTAGTMARVLRLVASTGRAFMQHCEDHTLSAAAPMHAGSASARLGLPGWPREAEEIIIERDLRLNRVIGCRYHAQHVSSAGSVEILRRARAGGQPVSGEATPHHLVLDHEACAGLDPNTKMNPPLREPADREALREAVADGVIDVLATDHAPHAADEKATDFAAAPFGIVGLETALALYAEALVETGAVEWARLIALMTLGPARLCGLDRLGLGSLSVGGPADVTVIDPDARWTVAPEDLAGRSSNCPFLGRKARARAVGTIVAGELRLWRRAPEGAELLPKGAR